MKNVRYISNDIVTLIISNNIQENIDTIYKKI